MPQIGSPQSVFNSGLNEYRNRKLRVVTKSGCLIEGYLIGYNRISRVMKMRDVTVRLMASPDKTTSFNYLRIPDQQISHYHVLQTGGPPAGPSVMPPLDNDAGAAPVEDPDIPPPNGDGLPPPPPPPPPGHGPPVLPAHLGPGGDLGDGED